MDSRQEPPAPAVDLVTGKSRPGKVSRTVSTSRLTLDLTVMCTPGTGVLQPRAAAQEVLPPGTVANTVPALQRRLQWWGSRNQRPRTFRHSGCRSPQTCFRRSSSSSPTLPWGTAEDSSQTFSPNRVREGHSPDVPGEGSLFYVSPLSPGIVVRPTRGSEGVLLPTMLEDFDDSVLGDPISYARFEQFPGSESPLSLPVYARPPSSAFLMDSAVIRTVLDPGKSNLPAAGTSKSDPPYSGGGGQVVRDRTARLSVPILGVRQTPVYRW